MKVRAVVLSAALLLLLAAMAAAGAMGKIEVLTGENLAKLIPTTVVLDGQNAPVQKRNTVGAQVGGKLLLVALIDTSGYSYDYQQKYVGVLIAQGKLRLGEAEVKPGFYGLGDRKTAMMGGEESHTFILYDMGGGLVKEIPAAKDEALRPVTPIQLKANGMGPARLYLGRYFVQVSSD
jgi:hypothetical protein